MTPSRHITTKNPYANMNGFWKVIVHFTEAIDRGLEADFERNLDHKRNMRSGL